MRCRSRGFPTGRARVHREAGRLQRRMRRASVPERPVNPRDTAAPVAAFKGTQTPLRPDLALIAEMVAPGSRVLDIGCSDGALLEFLAQQRGVNARGMELAQKNVNARTEESRGGKECISTFRSRWSQDN